MKKNLIITAVCILLTAPAFAATGIIPHKKKRDSKISLDFGGIRLGYSGLITNLGNMSLPDNAEYMSLEGKSINFDLTLLNLGCRLSNNLILSTGLDLEINNFRFENNISLMRDPGTGMTVANNHYNDSGILLKKTKLVTTYINVPLLLRVYMGKEDKFCLYGGVIGGWRIESHTKIKANSDQLKGKYKDHGNLNLRNFHGGYMVGFSYSYFGIYAKYYPQSIFKTGKGPDVQQVNVGLAIGF